MLMKLNKEVWGLMLSGSESLMTSCHPREKKTLINLGMSAAVESD